MSEFVSAAPPSGGITWAEHQGKLLVIEPLSFEQGIQTSFGSTDAVRANVHVLTAPGESEDYDDCLIFPKVLVGQTRGQLGKKVVGRLTSGTAKPGQSAPHMLAEATEDDLGKAQEWLSKQAPAVTSAQAPF